MSVERNGRIRLPRTGLMGTAMVHRLLGQGLSVIAWDKNRNHLRTLAQRSASIVDTVAEVGLAVLSQKYPKRAPT